MITASLPWRIGLAFLVAVVSSGCSNGDGVEEVSVVSISVTPTMSTVAKGLSQQFVAIASLSDGGKRDVSSTARWASSDPTVATMGASGLANTVAVGNTTVTAASDDVTGSASLAVSPAVLMSMSVTPGNASVALGANQPFAAVGELTDGTTADMTQAVTWSSSDKTVLLLNNSPGRVGIANTRGPGAATVTATSGAITGTASVAVTRRSPRFLYATVFRGSVLGYAIWGFAVDPAQGELNYLWSRPTSSLDIVATHDFKFLYGDDGHGYSIGADGALTEVNRYLRGSGCSGYVLAHPTADLLYFSSGRTVTTCAIDTVTGATGKWSSVDVEAPATLGLSATMTSDGTRLYQPVGTDFYNTQSRIVGYSASAMDGSLTAISGGSVSTSADPKYVAVDPAGKFLYVTVWKVNSVYAYAIDGVSGALTAVPGSPFTVTGGSENSMGPGRPVIDVSGRFLFVLNSWLSPSWEPISALSVFSIDADTGVPSPVPGSPYVFDDPTDYANHATDAIPDPSGRFVYISTVSGNIRTFEMDQATGALAAAGPVAKMERSPSRIVVTY